MNKQKALLVDDHSLVRNGIRDMINSNSEHTEVVAETDNGRDGLKVISELDIDLLITDLSMPEMDGIALIKAARKRSPDLNCIVLSMHTANEYVAAAFRAGACGYLHKNASTNELMEALDQARNGGYYMHPNIAGSLVDILRKSDASSDPLERLSDRQRDVLKLLAEGNSTKAIAEIMNVSPKTVETHRGAIMERLGIRDVPGLVKFAVAHGLVDLETW
ncbi:MAG: response regulator transcription factor [Pseudomonadota bacterium]